MTKKKSTIAEANAAHAAKHAPPPLDDMVKNAHDLQTKTFEPLRWVVLRVLPEGLTLMAGKPKIGKSWLALDIAVAVASGGNCLGHICEQGKVLALFLEDNDRRLQRRLTMMLGMKTWPKNLSYATNWPRLSKGGIERLREWIIKEKPRLVIIDILEKVRDRVTGKQTSQYSADYEAVEALQKLASECQISILLLHHQRKAGADDLVDTVSGTLGTVGGVDNLLVIGKDTGGHFLFGNGRDLEEFMWAVEQDKQFRWNNLGRKSESQASPEREKIVTVLRKAEMPMGVEAIAAAVGQKQVNVKNLLHKMQKENIVEREATGLYRMPKLQAEFNLSEIQ